MAANREECPRSPEMSSVPPPAFGGAWNLTGFQPGTSGLCQAPFSPGEYWSALGSRGSSGIDTEVFPNQE